MSRSRTRSSAQPRKDFLDCWLGSDKFLCIFCGLGSPHIRTYTMGTAQGVEAACEQRCQACGGRWQCFVNHEEVSWIEAPGMGPLYATDGYPLYPEPTYPFHPAPAEGGSP